MQNVQLLRVREVAARLGLARSTVYGMIDRGELPVTRIRTAVRVSEAALVEWIEARTEPIRTEGNR